jgi:hypothetical protein
VAETLDRGGKQATLHGIVVDDQNLCRHQGVPERHI